MAEVERKHLAEVDDAFGFSSVTFDTSWALLSGGDTLECEAEGTTIRAGINGSQILSGTDATLSSG